MNRAGSLRVALRLLALLATAGAAAGGSACGSTVVEDDDGGGGAGASVGVTGASGSGVTSATGTTGVTTGASGVTTGASGSTSSGAGGGEPCDEHADCPNGGVCDFFAGACAPGCSDDGTCGAGSICDPCATSSCPACDDCVGACVAAPPHTCDSHDDCGAAETCVFSVGGCYPVCDAEGGCPEGFECDPCATSSCPGCRDCGAACLPVFDGCASHEDCDPYLCVFDGGWCTEPCGAGRSCGSKAYCDECVTSSCPDCDDCVAGCVYLP